ncbi:GroES-like protein, partial [Tilletiaria anomala UBC 951]
SNTLAKLHGKRDIRITDVPLDPPGPGQVTVQVLATGTCGSDLHYYVHGANGAFKLQHPMCLGHESAGIVVDVGPSAPAAASGSAFSSTSPAAAEAAPVLSWKVGDRVAIEAGLPCRGQQGQACARCEEGRYNLCPRMRFASSCKTTPHLDGTLRRYMNWPAWSLHRIPDNVSLLSASLIEPLSVVLQGFRRARFSPAGATPASGGVSHYGAPDTSILIVGAGAVGLLACAAAKAIGTRFVAAIDIDQGRLDVAKSMGWADATFLLPLTPASASASAPPASASTSEAAHGKANGHADAAANERARRKAEDDASVAKAQAQADDLLRHFSSSGASDTALPAVSAGFDLVLECTGVPSCVQLSILSARPGGRVALIGMGHPIQSAFPIGSAALREVDILGVFRYASVYPQAIELLASGAITQRGAGSPDARKPSVGGIENLVSHRYRLEDAQLAFETMRMGKSEDGKGVVKVFIVDE